MENNLDLLNVHKFSSVQKDQFTALLSNNFNYALNSFNIQLFVLILSIVFTIIETFTAFYKLIVEYPVERVKQVVKRSLFTSFILVASLLLVGLFIIALMSGSFASEDMIKLYLKSAEKPVFNCLGVNILLPPIESLITKWRIFIVFYGVIFLIWEDNTLPRLRQRCKQIDSDVEH